MRVLPRLTTIQWTGAALMTLASAVAGVLLSGLLPPSHAVPPVALSQLGLDVDHADKAQVIAASMPVFRLVGAGRDEDNSRKNVRLWDATLKLNGEHLPNVPQEIGDCVAWGAANAVNYLQAVQIIRGPPTAEEFHPAHVAFIYGASRIWVGGKHGSRFRSDGSVGAYAAEALNKYGCLRADYEGVPPYSGAVSREWGAKGPPDWTKEIAAKNIVQTVAPVKTAAEARDAICNGFPCTIASGWWGTSDIPIVDGRRVARRTTAWGHQQCLIAYDGSRGEPLFYCLNSWGPNAHPAPLQGEPPGGYWIRFKDIDRVCQEGDSWAFSGFNGFPAAGPNWDELLHRSVVNAPPMLSVPDGVGLEGVSTMFAMQLLGCLAVGLVGLLLFRMVRPTRAAMGLVALGILSSGLNAQDFHAAASRPETAQQQSPMDPMNWQAAETRTVQTATTGDIWSVAAYRVTIMKARPRPQALVFVRQRGCSDCDRLKNHLITHATRLGWRVDSSPDADFRIVDVKADPSLASQYGVEVVPTTLYISTAGQVRERREGFVGSDWTASLRALF